MKERNVILAENEGVFVCTSTIVIMKEHQPFCRELSIFCIGYRVAFDRVV